MARITKSCWPSPIHNTRLSQPSNSNLPCKGAEVWQHRRWKSVKMFKFFAVLNHYCSTITRTREQYHERLYAGYKIWCKGLKRKRLLIVLHLLVLHGSLKGVNSSIGRTSDWKARRNTDAGSRPRWCKVFFPQSTSSADRLSRRPYSPRVQLHASAYLRTLKIPVTGSHTILRRGVGDGSRGEGGGLFCRFVTPVTLCCRVCANLRWWKINRLFIAWKVVHAFNRRLTTNICFLL